MNSKIIRILKKANNSELLKMSEVRKEIQRLNKELKPWGLDRNVKSPLDYYQLQIAEEGLKNKQTVEKLYEQIRNEMIDIWELIDYTKRNEFVYPRIHEAVIQMKSFVYQDKTVMIPFLEPVINALYDHETAVLELPQFFKMIHSFHDKVIDPSLYGILPYQAGFVDVQPVAETEKGYAVYDGRTHCLEIIGKDGKQTEVPLSLVCTGVKIDPAQALDIVNAILNEDEKELGGACVASGYIRPDLKKKLSKK